jgi:hypothetical protein
MKAVSKVNGPHLELDKLYIKGTIKDAFYELFTGSDRKTKP